MKKQTPHEIACDKIFADLQSEYLAALENECIEFGHYENLDQGYREFVYENWVLENLEDINEMVDFLGFDDFKEWFIDYAETENATDLSVIWTKELADTFYKIIKERVNKNA
jgi:hypothetical protein